MTEKKPTDPREVTKRLLKTQIQNIKAILTSLESKAKLSEMQKGLIKSYKQKLLAAEKRLRELE